jgi:hypothetical protein
MTILIWNIIITYILFYICNFLIHCTFKEPINHGYWGSTVLLFETWCVCKICKQYMCFSLHILSTLWILYGLMLAKTRFQHELYLPLKISLDHHCVLYGHKAFPSGCFVNRPLFCCVLCCIPVDTSLCTSSCPSTPVSEWLVYNEINWNKYVQQEIKWNISKTDVELTKISDLQNIVYSMPSSLCK